eukprot:CAMPEP_0201503236 /NCGR_PEP_ID=MMETSP0151_2-20130828/84559_1 /ASSEMBLY_ACC=CAM_ASM_000257 /TAXON_ID=200890 /ORGANISM="Paramoeba atlantica, Strain 621/1 / CCAP 1560/9" /LENGTH=202 /DNA_ID=CAMNT_0047896881 /DNA_START=1242 /DNA_END=1850 /DNA_ORIENTATION=-
MENQINLPKFGTISDTVFGMVKGTAASYSFNENFFIATFLKDPPSLKNDLLFVWSKRVEPRNPELLTEMFLENEIRLLKTIENTEEENKILREKIALLEAKLKPNSPHTQNQQVVKKESKESKRKSFSRIHSGARASTSLSHSFLKKMKKQYAMSGYQYDDEEDGEGKKQEEREEEEREVEGEGKKEEEEEEEDITNVENGG